MVFNWKAAAFANPPHYFVLKFETKSFRFFSVLLLFPIGQLPMSYIQSVGLQALQAPDVTDEESRSKSVSRSSRRQSVFVSLNWQATCSAVCFTCPKFVPKSIFANWKEASIWTQSSERRSGKRRFVSENHWLEIRSLQIPVFQEAVHPLKRFRRTDFEPRI